MINGACHCGAVTWSFTTEPDVATVCNCTVCRRYGVLWAYDYVDEGIHTDGATTVYIQGDRELGFHFCATCGCVAFWRGLEPDTQGRTRIAVNLRLAEPDAVGHIPVKHFDGFDTFTDLGQGDTCVADYMG